MSFEDQKAAQRALEMRLTDWGVLDSIGKARSFMDELVRRGWQMAPERESRPRPPKPHEACRDCGRHFDACLCDGGPTISPHMPAPDPTAKVARLKAIRDEVAGGQCSHHVDRRFCVDHRKTTPEPEPEGA